MKINAEVHTVSIYDLFTHEGDANLGAFDEEDVCLAVQAKVDELLAASEWPDRYLVVLSAEASSLCRWLPLWADRAPWEGDPDGPQPESLLRCHNVSEVRSKLPEWVKTIFDGVDARTFQLEHDK